MFRTLCGLCLCAMCIASCATRLTETSYVECNPPPDIVVDDLEQCSKFCIPLIPRLEAAIEQGRCEGLEDFQPLFSYDQSEVPVRQTLLDGWLTVYLINLKQCRTRHALSEKQTLREKITELPELDFFSKGEK